MHRLRLLPWFMIVCFAAVSTGAEARPNFSGIWKLSNANPSRSMIIEQNESDLRVFQFVEDRLTMFKGPIDGQPHSRAEDGSACDFLARWEENSLYFETKLHTHDSINPVVYIQHLMRLAANGKTMSLTRTNVTPRAGTFRETWERQDPLPGEISLAGFDLRLQLADRKRDLTDAAGHGLQCSIANAFNNVLQAEQECLAVINQQSASKFHGEARANLAEVYWRNGMVRKALRYWGLGERLSHGKLAKYPEVSVVHRGYARVQATRDSEGRLMLPVVAAGKDAGFMVDTGSNTSGLRMSEAKRLGLRLEAPRMHIVNGLTKFDAVLTIVPVLTVGATRLENVPFWVMPDARLDWPGIIGIDLLLQLETLRWDASGATEIGFPAAEKDPLKANLCFRHQDVLADVSANGQGNLVVYVDTGSNGSQLYPRFATRFLDFLSFNSKQSHYEMTMLGAHRELSELTVPEITLRIGGANLLFRSADVLLEKPPMHYQLHGAIGMDLLNSARRVSFDLSAMRLTLE